MFSGHQADLLAPTLQVRSPDPSYPVQRLEDPVRESPFGSPGTSDSEGIETRSQASDCLSALGGSSPIVRSGLKGTEDVDALPFHRSEIHLEISFAMVVS